MGEKTCANRKYRPSSGDEGMWFYDEWCARCTRDAAYRAGDTNGCPILAAAWLYSITDPEYPAEWQRGPDNKPLCAAFQAEARHE